MLDKTPLIGELLPQYEEWWQLLSTSPWLMGAMLLFVVLSALRHGELAYGSSRSTFLGWVIIILYFGAHLIGEVSVNNQALINQALINQAMWGLIFMIMLSDGIVSSLSHERSPFLVYNLGLLLGLLLLVHPGSLLLYPFYLYMLRGIKSASGRHVTALLLGGLSIIALMVMLFAHRSLGGIEEYLTAWALPAIQLEWPALNRLPLLVIDVIYLLFISVATNQSMRSSVVRVRGALRYHIVLVWLLMVLHIIYGVRADGHQTFITSAIFFECIMTIHFMKEKTTRWVALPLGLLAIAYLAIRGWAYLGV